MKPKRNKGRAPGQTSMTVSVPKELKDAVDNAARKDNRTKSNWLVTELTRMLKERGLMKMVA